MARKYQGQSEALSGTPQPNFTGYAKKPISSSRTPTTSDVGYEVGQIWIYTVTGAAYIFGGASAGSGTWLLASPGASDVDTLTGDSGGAISPVGGNIDIVGGTGVSVAGTAGTLTINLTGGGVAMDSFVPDAGTNPVVPSALGVVTMAGTANQITTTGGLNSLTFSLPAAITAPGSLTTTTTLAATTTVTGGTGLIATTGGVTATAGDIVATAGDISTTAGSITSATTLTATLGDITATNGNLVLVAAGNKINRTSVATTATAGANSIGSVTLVNGTATVTTSAVTANSLIKIWRQSIGSTGAAALGELSVGTITAGASFVISALQPADATAAQTTDVSVVGWEIVN